MDPRQNGQRPTARPAAVREQNAEAASASDYRAGHGKGSNKKASKLTAVVLALVALLVIVSYVAWQKYAPTPGVDSSKYQAVFLNNDQVYFGKIQKISDGTLVLTNIYYLQQATGQKSVDQASNTKNTDQSSLSLVKLGEELHGPQDEMRVNMEHVIFWENLKDNGKVAEAIKNYKK